MRKLFRFVVLFALAFAACGPERTLARLRSDHFLIGLDSKGRFTELMDTERRKNYLPRGAVASLLSCRVQGELLSPVSAGFDNDDIILRFSLGLEARIRTEEKSTHITFELVGFNRPEDVEWIAWGPVPTTIDGSIGETVGVVRGEDFAIGLQALNPKTLGGYPWNDNDCMPQFDIFEQDDYSDLSEANKREVLYRVEAAKPEDFGSTLQAYCRNRSGERIVSNLNHERYVSPVFEDGGIIGSRIALFGCPVDLALETVGRIELEENLPHPTIDGVWGKQARTASAAYLIYDFGEETIDEAITYTKKAGLRYLYHPGPFENWGHFELDEESFPNGWEGLERCVDRAAKVGVSVGVHTLSNFITTNDPYVTPVPDVRLAKVGNSVLTARIDTTQTEIGVESPDFFNQFENNTLRTAMAGEELIRYEGVSESAPWRLLGCERGAWGTRAATHERGDKIGKLAEHPYNVSLTDPDLAVVVAERIAGLFNRCGFRQISFDGLEGNRSTGMGNYGEVLFTTAWWDTLSAEIKEHAIIDASRTSHYFWHIYSRMNWGEPWYAGFRESQTEYRLKNQAYFERNLMPGMLGWFSLRDTTPVEDIEWMLARSAGFDAGYALVAGERQLRTNGQTAEILSLIGEWERARMAGAFSDEQKGQMKDIGNEFHLERVSEDRWNLHEIRSFKFTLEERAGQLGEPLSSTLSFENGTDDVTAHFIVTARDATLSDMRMELDGGPKIALPVSLAPGESARYSGGEAVTVCDPFLHKRYDVDIDPESFRIGKGSHTIVFECALSAEGEEPAAKLEIRLPERAEEVKAIEGHRGKGK